MRDWRNTNAYAFAAFLTREQWAWEFLRRNPDYRRAWTDFSATWRDLEAAYGSPPNRNFPAWRLDPRAWVPACTCPEGECRVDQDKVLIECALGARFGFHKFPPDPADDDPVGAGRLSWREAPMDLIRELGDEDLAAFGSVPAQVALGFDLSRPLRGQLEQAKRHLQWVQRLRVRDGSVTLVSVAAMRPQWTCALRLLDAEEAGADQGLIALICPAYPVEVLRPCAYHLRERGYLEMLSLPEG